MAEKYLLKTGLPADLKQEIIETLKIQREIVDVQKDNVERAIAAGVIIGAGTDRSHPYGPDPFADIVRELEVLHDVGLSTHQAILSATSVAAETMDWSERVGKIKSGFYADLLVVNRNPLDDLGVLRDVVMVMKGGEIVVDNNVSRSES